MLPQNIQELMKNNGIQKLNEPQEMAVKRGLLQNKNLVVASPTASGKTLIAEIAFLNNFMKGGKSVYIVPLKALATEKYHEFKEKYEKLGMKIAIAIGDLDSNDQWLKDYDIIIVSNEKMDSLLRHNVDWAKNISLMIIDEIHLLNDASRGPTLEIVITRLRQECSAQIIALSATISNAEEIAKWLSATLVKSDYRPIKLSLGTSYPEKENYVIDLEDKKKEQITSDDEAENILCLDTLKNNKQALFFLSTRRNAEALAERLAKVVEKKITAEEKKELEKISKEILNALPSPPKQCRRIAASVSKGTAFHHSGLVAKQRKLIEDSFKAGKIKMLTATPTLAFGVNLPAWRVLIRDSKRYTNYGLDYIPALEIQQMFGRAGRPSYDKEGQAILLAKSDKEAADLKNRYIYSDPEPIYSKLSSEPMLRTHVLALIATEFVKSRSEMREFFSKTFFAHQYSDVEEVMKRVEKIIMQIEDFGFITTKKKKFISDEFIPAFELDDTLAATRIGKRVSELYLDPISAHKIITDVEKKDDLDYLVTINQCMEMQPLMRVKQKEYEIIEEELNNSGIEFPEVWTVDYEYFLDAFKQSLFLNDWMNEWNEEMLMDRYGITPGEVHGKIKNAEWLLYSARELALLLNKKENANHLNKLKLRVKHGVKEELLTLVKLKGIGRVRARMLYKAGMKKSMDIKNAPKEKLEKILGKKVAENLLEQLEEGLEEKMRRLKRHYREME